MKSPGTLLRQGREQRELSLDDVATMTRIPRAMLEHLEKDRFEEYVAEVFVRGHLRNYARELGLEVEQILQAYERHTGNRRVSPMAGVERDSRRASGGARSRRSSLKRERVGAAADGSGSAARVTDYLGGLRKTHVVAALLVVIGLFLILGYLTNNRATAQDAPEFPEASESAWEEDAEETRWLLEQSDD